MRTLLAVSLVLIPLALPAADTPQLPALPTQAASAASPATEAYWQAMKLLRAATPADWPQARALLKQATDAEYPPALNFVALCHLNKQYGFAKDHARAANFLRLSAEQHNASACLLLGRCHYFGTGVRKNRTEAATWFRAVLAAEADFATPEPPADLDTTATGTAALPANLSGALPVDPADQLRANAHLFLGQICAADKKPAEAQDHFVQAATQGPNHSAGLYEAAIQAAINYAFGEGIPRDMHKADEMLALSKTLARRNVLLVTSNMVEQKLVDDFAQADVEEDATAETDKIETQLQFAIAGSFADPKSKTYDPKEAAKWYELAAEKNEAWAMLSLAFLHHEGRLGQRDPAKTFEWFKRAAERGNHNLGWANLSICYEQGLGTPVDHAKAAEIWEKYRNDNTVCHLGTIGQCPTDILTYEQELELTRTWAEKKHDATAQYLLARRYLYGWGIAADLKKGLRWLRKAAGANQGAALHLLGLLYQNSWALMDCGSPEEGNRLAFPYLEMAAATDYPAGIFQLGYCYDEGLGCPRNKDKAVELYQRSLSPTLEPGDAFALNNLGVIYENRARAAWRRKDAAKLAAQELMSGYYRQADTLGNALAAYNLGRLAYEGLLQPKDLQQAYSYFESAASRGYSAQTIHFKLGSMLEKGEGVPVSLREAAYHYRLAALDGNNEALVKLCKFYAGRVGFTRDWDRALYWLSRLARTGDPGAYVDLGNALLQKGAYAESLKYHQQMRKNEDPWLQGYAYERLSRQYRDGLGTRPDPKLAAKYHDKACELGNRDALFLRYQEYLQAGRTKEALILLDRAAKDGLPEATAVIGRRFLRGDGLPQNGRLGLQCLQSAAEAGDPTAITAIVQATLDRVPGALSVEAVWKYVQIAEECDHPDAARLQEELAALQPQSDATSSAPAETGIARPL